MPEGTSEEPRQPPMTDAEVVETFRLLGIATEEERQQLTRFGGHAEALENKPWPWLSGTTAATEPNQESENA